MEITREINEKGQVVIPIDIRRMLDLKKKSRIVFQIQDNEVKIKKELSPEMWLKSFLKYRVKGKSLTPEKIDKIYEQSYDLP